MIPINLFQVSSLLLDLSAQEGHRPRGQVTGAGGIASHCINDSFPDRSDASCFDLELRRCGAAIAQCDRSAFELPIDDPKDETAP